MPEGAPAAPEPAAPAGGIRGSVNAACQGVAATMGGAFGWGGASEPPPQNDPYGNDLGAPQNRSQDSWGAGNPYGPRDPGGFGDPYKDQQSDYGNNMNPHPYGDPYGNNPHPYGDPYGYDQGQAANPYGPRDPGGYGDPYMKGGGKPGGADPYGPIDHSYSDPYMQHGKGKGGPDPYGPRDPGGYGDPYAQHGGGPSPFGGFHDANDGEGHGHKSGKSSKTKK